MKESGNEYEEEWKRQFTKQCGWQFSAYFKMYKKSGISPMGHRGEIDLYVIKPLYDMRHIFKENTEVRALCFCANAAFEEFLWNGEIHNQRDGLMDMSINIL